MASSTIEKHTISETSAQIDHDNRKGKTHKNQDINPELKSENVYLDGRDKREILNDIKNDVADMDKVCPPKRKTKDRVVTLEISIPYPREIAPILKKKPTKEEEKELIKKYVLLDKDSFTAFFKDADEVIKSKYGKTYGACIHYDECHYYYDKNDGMYHMSRPHLHTFVTAQAEVKDNPDIKRINGKDALKRGTYKEINHLLDAPSLEHCNCPFEDGRGKKSQGSVEDMKADSIRREQDRHETLIEENKDAEIFLNANVGTLDAQEELIEENIKVIAEQERKKADYEAFTKVDHQTKDFKKVKVFGKKETHYAVPEQKLECFCTAAYEVPKLKDEISDKDKTISDKDATIRSQADTIYSKNKEISKYKGYKEEKKKMIADFQKRLNKVKKSPFKDPSDMSHLIHEYVLLKVSNEKEKAAILKACEALDKLDAYQWRTVGYTTYFDGSFDKEYSRLQSKLKEEYMKILDYGGRAEMYDEINDIWTDSKEVSKRVWMNTKSSNAAFSKSVQSVHSQYEPLITGILSDLLSLVRAAFELIQEASYGYGGR